LKRFFAAVILLAILLPAPMYARHSTHKINPEAKAAQKRAKKRAKALRKAAKQAQKRNRQAAGH
jgi:hypothetical protein